MKKILQINILNETGSTGRIMQNISKSLESSDKYIVFTAYGYADSTLNNSIKIGNQISYIIHNIGSKLFCNQGFYSKYSTRKLIKFIQNEKIDLIHLHNIHGNYINIQELFEYIIAKDIPIIWTLHDCWPFTGKCTHFDLCNCTKWKTICHDCPILQEYPKSFILDKTKENYILKKNLFSAVKRMYFVSPSNWLATLFKDSFLNKYPISVIHNGVDISQFHYINNDLKQIYNLKNKFIILGVASPWSKRKGLDDFIKLSNSIDNKYQIVLIGIDKKTKSRLPSSIYSVEKTNNIQELAMWYSVADVFVNPTYEDNFPTVNLEALACNAPIVTYNTGGSVEVVNKNTGLVCEKGNINELINKIAYVCNHHKMYKDCSKFIEKQFEYQSVFNQYLRLYDSILEDDL